MNDPNQPTTDLQASVLEWLRGERAGQLRHLMITELRNVSRHMDVWPRASEAQWNTAIDACIKRNLVTERAGKLMIVPDEPKTSEPTQMSLF